MGQKIARNWKYRGEEITSIPPEYVDAEGFIYKITLEDGTYYFGKKNLELSAKRKIGKRELAERGKSAFRKYKSKKGKNKGEWIYYEDLTKSDWQEYYGSSEDVKYQIESGIDYTKEILEFAWTKGELTWLEHKLIVCSDCMEQELCLNRRVGNFHKKHTLKYAENRLQKDKK